MTRRRGHQQDVDRLLRGVKEAISSSAKRFSGNQQQDAHEFLLQVLDQLKEEVIRAAKYKDAETGGKISIFQHVY